MFGNDIHKDVARYTQSLRHYSWWFKRNFISIAVPGTVFYFIYNDLQRTRKFKAKKKLEALQTGDLEVPQ
ncbi:Hypothetical predicted protein [Mytilus galloprovincialis]|uniref:Uncharacterized protein n=1 Tax=Mytilus galloprovincialis TaxID=29158 RepID=A0A8B6FTQ7_MYTGA|nr:Hypothetical predicted protein [Mytilus galloprovincialis]